MTRTSRLFPALLIAVVLALGACGADAPEETAASDTSASEGAESTTTIADETPADADDTPSSSGGLDADGYVVPGEVVRLELGESVSYHSMPKLTLDDAQKVTIHSVEYIEKVDLGDEAPHDRFETGVLVVSLTWETLKGSVQSNQSYLEARLDSGGDKGIALAFRDDRLRNGGISDTEPESGTFTIALERGSTTLTLFDYVGAPVAEWHVDTSE